MAFRNFILSSDRFVYRPAFSMKCLVHVAQVLVGDVGVDLGGGDVGVAESTCFCEHLC